MGYIYRAETCDIVVERNVDFDGLADEICRFFKSQRYSSEEILALCKPRVQSQGLTLLVQSRCESS